MSHPNYLDKHILSELNNIENKTILDCCCGIGLNGFNIRMRKEEKPILIGVDIYPDYIYKLKNLRIYNRLYRLDIVDFVTFIKHEGYDFILLVESLEHMNKNDAEFVLKELNKMCLEKMIVTTPERFVQTNNITKDNSYNNHVSGDYDKLLLDLGFKEKKLDIGLHINMFLKNVYCRLTNRNIDALSKIYIKEY